MEILIDEDIRNWVFIPILIAMTFFSLIKQQVFKLLKAPNLTSKCSNQQSYDMKIQNSCLLRAKKFEQNHNLLVKESFQNRQTLYCKKDGLLTVNAIEQPQDMTSAMQNSPMSPDNMSKMMGSSMAMMILFPLQMKVIYYFFSGMIVGKVSFPLTQQFRQVLQTGINVGNIDVKYISSLSLYFLTYLGLETFFNIFLKKNQNMSMQNEMMMPTAQQPPNPLQQAQGNQNQKRFENQLATIKTLNYECMFDNIEDEFLDTFSEDQFNQENISIKYIKQT